MSTESKRSAGIGVRLQRLVMALVGGGKEGPSDTAPKHPPDSCPDCHAALAYYKVTGVSRRGKVVGAEKTWACGSFSRLHFFREVEFKRGDRCHNEVADRRVGESQETTKGER